MSKLGVVKLCDFGFARLMAAPGKNHFLFVNLGCIVRNFYIHEYAHEITQISSFQVKYILIMSLHDGIELQSYWLEIHNTESEY